MALTGFPDVAIGHWTDDHALTGCTVVVLPPGSRGSYEVRGGAPAERELLPLDPEKSVDCVDAVVLTGGSVFGLACADGVVSGLAERGRGVATPAGPVPIVPTLGLFDLGVGDPTVRPTAASGRSALAAARPGEVVTGLVGAGTGARFGKWVASGPHEWRPGGIRYAQRRAGDVVVGVLVAVNAAGSVVRGDDDADAAPLLGRSSGFGFRGRQPVERGNTTIGCVLTNARLDKLGCRVVAQGAHDGLARAVTPPHSRTDGDGFVACSVGGGSVEAPVDLVRLLALGATVDALRTALGPLEDAPRPDQEA